MGRSSRLFEIVQLLRGTRAPITARAMADVLEVSKRTIYRDIVSLQAMRVPVEGEAGIGYVMRAGCDLPPLMFTADEVEAIAVGLALLGRTGDPGLQRAASSVSRKLAEVLPDGSTSGIESVPLYASRWNAIPLACADVRVMRQAIRDERKLNLRYQDVQDRTTQRTVRPIAIVYYVAGVVLAAWCELRDDYRHFRIDRIEACLPTASLFKGQGQRLRADWPRRR